MLTVHRSSPSCRNKPSRGLAGQAARATHLTDGHQIEFRAMEVRGILNRSGSRRQLSLAYSINPYRGCEFACRYCYARYTHTFLGLRAPPASASRTIRIPRSLNG